VDTKTPRSGLGPHEKTALALVAGVSALIWAILALFLLSDVDLAAERSAAMPVQAYTPVFSTPILSSPILSPSTAIWTVAPTPVLTATAALTPTFMSAGDPLDNRANSLGDDYVVVALLGMDQERDSVIWRTDAILLAFIDPSAGRIGILSIPRDLWVSIPGYGYSRINTVDALGERVDYPGGGPLLLNQTLSQNLGVSFDHYVRVDLSGFVRIVDVVGGVTVDVEKPIRDRFPDPDSPTGYSRRTLPAGPLHMDGQMALSYCRSRITTDDFDRTRRQQQVLIAMWKKGLTPQTLLQAPRLWAELRDAFETDLSLVEAVQLAYVIYGIGPENVETRSLDFKTARPWTTPSGAQVLLPQISAIKQLIHDLVSPAS
jgi:LCP family protein required for cell wall assembly